MKTDKKVFTLFAVSPDNNKQQNEILIGVDSNGMLWLKPFEWPHGYLIASFAMAEGCLQRTSGNHLFVTMQYMREHIAPRNRDLFDKLIQRIEERLGLNLYGKQ
jgi:hypothetical protein